MEFKGSVFFQHTGTLEHFYGGRKLLNYNFGGGHRKQPTVKYSGLTCVINIVKPKFILKTVDLWSYIMPALCGDL